MAIILPLVISRLPSVVMVVPSLFRTTSVDMPLMWNFSDNADRMSDSSKGTASQGIVPKNPSNEVWSMSLDMKTISNGMLCFWAFWYACMGLGEVFFWSYNNVAPDGAWRGFSLSRKHPVSFPQWEKQVFSRIAGKASFDPSVPTTGPRWQC